MANGIYRADGTFQPFQYEGLSTELATRQNAGITFGELESWLNVLPDPDPILRKRGDDAAVLADLLADDQVTMALLSRKNRVLNCPDFSLRPGAPDGEDPAPEASPDFHPCMSATERPVLPLARHNVHSFVRHAANVGRMLARLHIRLPIVATPDGTVINGMGRLEAAARKGRESIAVVELAAEKADFARAMFNLLSMDFRFTGDNADFLRYGAFRREWLRRIHLGRAFVLPVYSHKKLADVALDDKFMGRWRQVCGDSVLDFGSGQGDEARMLRAKGIRVTEFEPYPADRDTVNREKGRASAMSFLSAVRAATPFSAIFVSSVLNSVPFPEDREHILRIVAALCGPETAVFFAARSTKGNAWEWHVKGESMSNRASRGCQFKLAMEPGVHIGDVASAPKVQKFYEPEEWRALMGRFFGQVQSGHADGMTTAICRKSLAWRPRDLAASLRFEFNLPYPDGKRMELASFALAAFSRRLGFPLERD